MNEKLLTQLNNWFEQSKHHDIIKSLVEIPKAELDYELINHLGRAYNNIGEYGKAIDTLSTVSEPGMSDALWAFRMAYAYYYKDENESALYYFEKSAELGDDTAVMYIHTLKARLDPKKKAKEAKRKAEQAKQEKEHSKKQVEIQTQMLNQSKDEFEQNITAIKSDFPFGYWQETLFTEYEMEQYTPANCKKAEDIMNDLIGDLIQLGLKASEDSKLEKFKTATLKYNVLNEETNHALIETGERESLCEIIDKIGITCGILPSKYGDGDGIASEWRDW